MKKRLKNIEAIFKQRAWAKVGKNDLSRLIVKKIKIRILLVADVLRQDVVSQV
jgi:hypothetical protein